MRLLTFLLAAGALHAQLSFEAATVKPAPLSAGKGVSMGMHTYGDRASIYNMTLPDLMAIAYRVDRSRILGGPTWISVERFNVEGRFPAGVNDRSVPAMMKSLLEDRFALKLRHEDRQAPVFELIVAKKGPRLTPSLPSENVSGHGSNNSMDLGNVTVAHLAEMLTERVGRPVIDKTAIPGNFDFNIEWGPEETGPSIYTVLEEKYGLKLNNARKPIDHLVIENAAKPTDN